MILYIHSFKVKATRTLKPEIFRWNSWAFFFFLQNGVGQARGGRQLQQSVTQMIAGAGFRPFSCRKEVPAGPVGDTMGQPRGTKGAEAVKHLRGWGAGTPQQPRSHPRQRERSPGTQGRPGRPPTPSSRGGAPEPGTCRRAPVPARRAPGRAEGRGRASLLPSHPVRSPNLTLSAAGTELCGSKSCPGSQKRSRRWPRVPAGAGVAGLPLRSTPPLRNCSDKATAACTATFLGKLHAMDGSKWLSE